jgi:hypothetical protein
MRLSEAISISIQQWPATWQERFCWINERLHADVWGGACWAVQPAVARFNWHDRSRLQSSLDALNAVQHHYFDDYWQMPAQCPGSQQRFIAAGGRIISNRGDGQLKVYEEGQTVGNLGAVTSECDRVTQMAGMVDHLFYAHNWTREQVLEAVKWYEETRTVSFIAQHFTHYSPNVTKYVKTLVRPAANGGAS